MRFFNNHPTQSAFAQMSDRLDGYYQEIKSVILSRQHPVTGLLPASTAINEHGNYTDAWVRDNVYSILAVWGLALTYRKVDAHPERTYELEHSVIKLMRGLLYSMMRQSEKVERFKVTQAPWDSLHAKYNTATGDTVVGDGEWGHLQLDATSLYLLMLAQMTASGLHIIYSQDEVAFIQNLVYYIGRAYRTPDYGIWERGNKINHGDPELNASSIGMAKAALEALNGFNLFGIYGTPASVIHVLPDDISRIRVTLESLLPRESSSKEVDAALLSVIGFPAFAVEDEPLRERTRTNILSKLSGNYGCKRFLRDGHQTVIEDSGRLYYEPTELQQFENLECEWPLFFAYLWLDALFREDHEQAEHYHSRLKAIAVEQGGYHLLPELYYVPEDCIEAERETPHSQVRVPNANIPLVWAQSLYYLGELLKEGLLVIGDLDPLGRYRHTQHNLNPTVQVALLAEDCDLQRELSHHGIAIQMPQDVQPIRVRQAGDLAAVYHQIGRNDALGLTGRPRRRLQCLTTSRVFNIQGETLVFLPSFLDQQQFYLTLDYHFLVAQIKGELAHLHRHWQQLGCPTLTLLLTREMFEAGSFGSIEQSPLLALVRELQSGNCDGIPVQVGYLHDLVRTASTTQVDDLQDFHFPTASVQDATPAPQYLRNDPNLAHPLTGQQEFYLECETESALLLEKLHESQNLYEQVELLEALCRLEDLDFETDFGSEESLVTVADLLNEVYEKASRHNLWAIIRRSAGLLEKIDIGLSEAMNDIMVRQKQIAVGKSLEHGSIIDRPLPPVDIMNKLCEFCGEDVRDRALSQEILIYLSVLLKTDPDLFKGFLTLRVSYLILLLTSELAMEQHVTQDIAYERLMQLSPFEIKARLRQVLAGYDSMNQVRLRQESLHLRQHHGIQWAVNPTDQHLEPAAGSWWRQRQLDGALNRVPPDFYPRVWQVLQHCKGLAIGDKLEQRNRLESSLVLAEMTPGEKNFALCVEHLLNKIQTPEYRQLNIEALMELAAISDRNPELEFDDYIVLDVLIGHAVRLAWCDQNSDRADQYDDHTSEAWLAFYEGSPYLCAGYIADALRYLSELGQDEATDAAQSEEPMNQEVMS